MSVDCMPDLVAPSTGSNQPSYDRCSDPGSSVPILSSRKGKNTRKRSRDSDEEACSAPPPKKRVNSQRPPTTSPVVERAAPRRSTRRIGRSSTKNVPAPAEPESDVIVIDDDGHPYVTYDDAPHLHPPPQRHKPSEPGRPAEKVKGCSIKACWTPTQQRRCRLLQTDPAVEEIGWKKVRKWMQAVRCRLCGETQVLRDLTKGCFNLEHWWRHLRVRHGVTREEEIQEKGEEKYKMLPIKDHVCVGVCSTCGGGEEAVSTAHLNTRHAAWRAAVESSDISSPFSVDATPDTLRQAIPESTTSTPRVEPPAPGDGDAPMAGPSNANYPRSHSDLYTLANARPQYQSESVAIGVPLPISGLRDLPPLIPQSWAAYVDPSLYVNPPSPRRPPTGHLGNSTPCMQQTRPLSSNASTSPSPRLPFVQTAPPVARGELDTMDAADALLFLNRGPPVTTATPTPATANAASATRTRPRFRSTSGPAQAQTPLPTAASATQPSSVQPTSGGSPSPPSHSAPMTAEAVAVAPGLSNYRWPPANTIPVGAPSPPEMAAASWEGEGSNTEDEEGRIEAPPTSDLPRNVPTRAISVAEDYVVANGSTTAVRSRPLYRSHLPAWESRSEDHEMDDGLTEPTPAPRLQLQVEAGDTGRLLQMLQMLQPGWAFIEQEESEPDLPVDEDDDMVDQLLDDR